jgi:hypothetical protein
MAERLATWGEVCERAGVTPDTTPAGTPVTKLLSAGAVLSAANAGSTERPCDYGTPCGSCACNPE